MRQRVRFCLALAVVVAACAAQTATAATLVTTVQSAVGSGAGTYIDLDSNPAGVTNGGITGIWSNYSAATNAWEFPDPSNADIAVLENSADDKTSSPVGEIQADYTGLMASQLYEVYAIVIADIRTTSAGSANDLEWGTTSGSLTTIDDSVHQYLAENSPIASSGNGRLIAVPLGQLAASGSGDMTLFFGPGTHNGTANSIRTQFDGVLFDPVPNTVPEPSTWVLLGLSAVACAWRKRRS